MGASAGGMTGDESGGTPPPATPPPDPNPPRTFTQDEVDRMMGTTRKEARQAASNQLLSDLGVENLDALKGIITAATEAAEKDKTELQRLTDKATSAESTASTLKAQLQERDLTDQIVEVLYDSGLTLKAARTARRLIDLNPGATEDDISEAVNGLKTTMPTLFEASPPPPTTTDNKPPPPNTNPGGGPAPGTQATAGQSVSAKGKAIYEKRHPQTSGT